MVRICNTHHRDGVVVDPFAYYKKLLDKFEWTKRQMLLPHASLNRELHTMVP